MMLLGGLWHGAAWTFVVWGGLHGTYLIVERELRARYSAWTPGSLALFGLGLLTHTLVNLTAVFFRAGTSAAAWRVLRGMTGFNHDASRSSPRCSSSASSP